MGHVIEVGNIRCSGCANIITSTLQQLHGVCAASVEIENDRDAITAQTDYRDRFVAPHPKNSDPERGSTTGLQTAKAGFFIGRTAGNPG